MKDYALNRGDLMDAWRRYSYSMYHSGVKLAMRSQPRSKYPRYVYLQGRTEPCSELVIEGYGCLRVSCSSRRLLAESMTESKDRQERCLAADSLRQQDARPRRCQSTEPPYAEPLVRWCGRTHGELIPMLLLDSPLKSPSLNRDGRGGSFIRLVSETR